MSQGGGHGDRDRGRGQEVMTHASSTISANASDPAIPLGSITTFDHTSIGKLPNEVLLEIGHYLARQTLTDLALVSPRLRQISEELLYSSIDLMNRGGSMEYIQRADGNFASSLPRKDILGLFYRTMLNRPKLRALVKRFYVYIESPDETEVEVPTSALMQ